MKLGSKISGTTMALLAVVMAVSMMVVAVGFIASNQVSRSNPVVAENSLASVSIDTIVGDSTNGLDYDRPNWNPSETMVLGQSYDLQLWVNSTAALNGVVIKYRVSNADDDMDVSSLTLMSRNGTGLQTVTYELEPQTGYDTITGIIGDTSGVTMTPGQVRIPMTIQYNVAGHYTITFWAEAQK